jgi:hypothetical protein
MSIADRDRRQQARNHQKWCRHLSGMFLCVVYLHTQFFSSPVMSSSEPPIFDPQSSEPHLPNSSSSPTDVFNPSSPSQIEIDLTISSASTRNGSNGQPLLFSAIVLGLISLVAISTAVIWVNGIMHEKSNHVPEAQTTIWHD